MQTDKLNKTHSVSARDPIALVCAADNRYSMPLAVTVRSVLEKLSHNQPITIFVLDGGIKSDNKQKIIESLDTDTCDIQFLPISDSLIKSIEDSIFEKGFSDHVSIATYFRLLIPRLLPENLKKVIYLDCDLVVKQDINLLWQTDVAENYVFATHDTWIRSVSGEYGLLNYQELGIPHDTKYFNAGVLLINLDKWRCDNISDKAFEYLGHNSEYIRWDDQDVLNALFAGAWGELDPRWNVTDGFYTETSQKDNPFTEDVYNTIVQDPYIIHFSTAKKPWNSRHVNRKEDFFSYVDKTAWAGWRLTRYRRIWLRLAREYKQIFLKK